MPFASKFDCSNQASEISFADIINVVQEYLQLITLLIAECFWFHKWCQKAELKNLSKLCQFSNGFNDAL